MFYCGGNEIGYPYEEVTIEQFELEVEWSATKVGGSW